MILSDQDIVANMDNGFIKIDPFDPACLGPNSYDVHLGSTLITYVMARIQNDRLAPVLGDTVYGLDCKKQQEPEEHVIDPDAGIVLMPGTLYLASTLEYTETHGHVPYLDGKSSVGRLGIRIHATAGRGDIGFCGYWTMEIDVIHPVRVYAGMPIGQLTYHLSLSEPNHPYGSAGANKASYNNRDPKPQASRMWKNFR